MLFTTTLKRAYLLDVESDRYTDADLPEGEDEDEDGRQNVDAYLATYGSDYDFNGLGALYLNEIW